MRVVVVDDEPLARQAMRQLLAAHDGVELAAEAANVSQARQVIMETRPDAVFLDVQMPGADGFDLLRQLPKIPPIVFVSAHSRHALRAFELPAVDYLLKPVHPKRLAETLARLQALLSPNEKAESSSPPADRISFRSPSRTIVCATARVVALQAEGDFVRVFVDDEMPFLVCQTLTKYLTAVPQPPFAMLGRSLIINTDRVKKIEKPSRSHTLVHLKGAPDPFVLGRAAARRLQALL